MHPLIPIHDLAKLTDAELLELEAALRNLILNSRLTEDDLARCAATLSNVVFVRLVRTGARSEIGLP